MGKFKPLKQISDFIPNKASFGSIRKFDIHTGIDLYCQDNDEVFAIEDGYVKKIDQFTGGQESPWWHDTQYIGILGASGFIVYGEVNPLVKEGDFVRGGQHIANVKKVLKKEKGSPTSMLHLELYEKVCEPVVWNIGEKKPGFLLDPTFLIK